MRRVQRRARSASASTLKRATAINGANGAGARRHPGRRSRACWYGRVVGPGILVFLRRRRERQRRGGLERCMPPRSVCWQACASHDGGSFEIVMRRALDGERHASVGVAASAGESGAWCFPGAAHGASRERRTVRPENLSAQRFALDAHWGRCTRLKSTPPVSSSSGARCFPRAKAEKSPSVCWQPSRERPVLT